MSEVTVKQNLKSIREPELEKYCKDGFVKLGRKIFSDSDFQDLKLWAENAIIERNQKEKSIAMGSMHFFKPEILIWILSDNILDIAEDFLGPNIGFLNSTIFYKKPMSHDIAYWHNDTGGFEKYKLFEEPKVINLTVALTRNNRATGCMKCLPGTQFLKIKHDRVSSFEDVIMAPSSISEERLDLSSMVYLELEENEASVHDVRVIHGSDRNPSPYDRMTLSMRFFSASTKCNLEGFRNSKMIRPFLVRGVDAKNSGLPFFSIK